MDGMFCYPSFTIFYLHSIGRPREKPEDLPTQNDGR
jgi:hypothetical protein